ncbi:MAG TPA: MHYT domain-containing protein [Burkholderiales bacterium]|nr:MHYT domain-containing protein [Burkholderiales bacterium]
MGEIHYQPLLVALSYVISVLGSYTALRLAVAIPQAQDRVSAIGWTLGAATALGGGAIWSMHFIGMNAADMGVPVAYDATLTFTSLLLAIVAPGVGLYMVGRGQGSVVKLVLAGIFTGLGVAVMHYTGMAAMIMPATINYDPNLFNLSLVIAVAAATVAFWLAFNLRGNLQRFGSALVMGVAVCGMHYTGMYAVRLEHTAQAGGTGVYLPPSAMAYTIFAITAVLMLLLLVFNAWRVQQQMSEEIA